MNETSTGNERGFCMLCNYWHTFNEGHCMRVSEELKALLKEKK
jgi:hypothetical protein